MKQKGMIEETSLTRDSKLLGVIILSGLLGTFGMHSSGVRFAETVESTRQKLLP